MKIIFIILLALVARGDIFAQRGHATLAAFPARSIISANRIATRIGPKDLPLDQSNERCYELESKGRGYSNGNQYQKAYDTLRFYLENCPHYDGAYYMFSEVGSNAASLTFNQKLISTDFRNWLKSVLYLNSDSTWYCADAIEIAYSFLFSADGKENHIEDGNAAVTICRYLLDSGKCSLYTNSLRDIWSSARRQQYINWRDTVKDSVKTPYDTSFKTLEQLGLTLLRNGTQGITPDIFKPINRHPISEVRAVPNPIKDIVELQYKLTEGALVRIEIFDALGRQLYAAPQGYCHQGDNALRLNTKDWSSGSYYARFTTLGGEVRTVKLVKE